MTQNIPEKFLLLHVLLYNIDNILNPNKKGKGYKMQPFPFLFFNHSIYYSASYSMASLSVSSSSNA